MTRAELSGDNRRPAVALVGVGQVGRALLERFDTGAWRLVAASDRTATVHAPGGLDPRSLLAHKATGRRLYRYPGARQEAFEEALTTMEADLVCDCTSTDLDDLEGARRRSLRVLDRGMRLAAAAKAGALAAPRALFGPERLARYGCNAVLGGTGAAFKGVLTRLRLECEEIVAVPNVTTTLVIAALEEGANLEEALAGARAAGLLEADPTQDLDGRDGAVKLAILAQAVYGRPLDWRAIPRDDLHLCDPELLRDRRRRGCTTRLVCRADARGGVGVRLEEVPRDASLAIPPDRLLYTYRLADGTVLRHTGFGLGPGGTAEALLADLRPLLGREVLR